MDGTRPGVIHRTQTTDQPFQRPGGRAAEGREHSTIKKPWLIPGLS